MARKTLLLSLALLLMLSVSVSSVQASAAAGWRTSGTDWLYVHWFNNLGRPAGIPAGAFNIEVERTRDVNFIASDQFIYAASHAGGGIFRRRVGTAWENLGRPGGSDLDQFYAVSPFRTVNVNTPGVIAGVVSASTARRGVYTRLDGGAWTRVYSANSVAHVGGASAYLGADAYFITTNNLVFHYSWNGSVLFGTVSIGTIDSGLPVRTSINSVRHNQNVTTYLYHGATMTHGDPINGTNTWQTISRPAVPAGTAGGSLFRDTEAGHTLYAANSDGAVFRLNQTTNVWDRMGQFAGNRNHYKIDELGHFFRISPDGNNVERGIAVRRPNAPVLLAPETAPPPVFTFDPVPAINVQNPIVRKDALAQFRYDGVAYGTQTRWEIQTATDSAFTAGVQTQVVTGTANEVTLARTLTEGRWFIRLRVQSNTAQGTSNHWSSWSAARTFDVDITPPTGSFTINSGAAFTVNQTVTLTLTSSGASHVRYRNAPSGAWTAWETVPFMGTRTWDLGAGDGTKTVEVQYRDAAWNTITVSRSIVLDTVAPTITANPASRGGGGPVTVNLSLADATSGIRRSRHVWTNSPTPPGTGWSVWNTTQTAYSVSTTSVGTWHLHVQAEDNAGNTRTQSFGPYQVDPPFGVTGVTLDEIFYGDPPGAAPRTVNAGAWVLFSVNLSAPAQSVSVNPGTGAIALTHHSGNRWTGSFSVPITAANGTVYNLTVTAVDAGGTPHTFTNVPFVSVSGNVWSRVRFRFIF